MIRFRVFIFFIILVSRTALGYIPNGFSPILLADGKYLSTSIYPARAESTHSYDVRHYKLQLTIPMTSGAYSAKARIKFVVREDNFDTFNLHCVNLVCDSVKRQGNSLTFISSAGRLKVNLDRIFNTGETCIVDIYYHREAGASNRGVYYYPRGTYPALMYTTTEPSDSRYWFPCFDENWDKAEEGCEIYVTVPDSFVVCSNGLLDSVISAAGQKTYYWRHSYPIATYLMTFTSSIYATYSHWYQINPLESLEIKYYIWRVDSARSHQAFQNVIDMVSFFVSRFGPYPFEKYGMNAVYPFIWGGMENQTMTMIHRSWLNGNDPGIAHELAHMWFGDQVTCFGWHNIWLNEGFATYSDALYMRHQQGEGYFQNVMTSRANSYFSEDNSMRFPIYDPPESQLFSWGHIYCKGSWVLHMLRYLLGDTIFDNPGVFFNGLRAYLDSFAYKNASTEDLKRILERVTNRDLDWFFDEWVYQAGYPQYYYAYQTESTGSPNQYRVIVRISQNNGALAPTAFHMPIQLYFTASGCDTLVVMPISNNPEVDTFILSFVPTQLVLDPKNWILKRSYLAIEELSNRGGVRLPYLIEKSPARSLITFNWTGRSPDDVEINIYDQSGKLVNRYKLSSTARTITIDKDRNHNKLRPGIYFIKITTKAAQFTEKVVLLP
ncbi:MAG: M1 family aminopeptidase [candidate division WOR-3 bacterium]